VAVLVPNWDKLATWALANSLPNLSLAPSTEELRDHPDVQAFLKQEIVLRLKDKVKKYEMPQAWLLLTEPFSVENELLTPKMSIKRHAVVAKYNGEIEAIYAEAAGAKAGAKEGVAQPAGRRPQVVPA
jgi:long-chain acyl-CoA synthetase